MMAREHRRRRSPESSRRRRRERRDSREQLHNHPIPTSIPTSIPPLGESPPQSHQIPFQQPDQQPYQEPSRGPYREPYQEPYQPDPSAHDRNRDRGYSSSFSNSSFSSSTSSSLLNVSQPTKRFGIGAFFSGDSRRHRRRVKKRRSRILRFGNSSSSSVGSDLAYGRGYIDRRRSREFSPPNGQRPPAGDSDPERSRPVRRAQSDKEIIELGRKFAEIARQQNAEDLRAAGRVRPSALAGAVAALNQLRRANSGNLNRGVSNSKPHQDSSSDDSDWESASSDDESSGEDTDNGLAYGSSHHLPRNPGGPSHSGASVEHAQPYSQDIPLNRKPSLVDPKLFGPINSLRGFVRTPCGFERVDRTNVDSVHQLYGPPTSSGDTVLSVEDRPLQRVYAVPTSDPSRFDVGRGSIVSAVQDSATRTRPEPVPIQQPKPIAPVYTKVFDSVDVNPDFANTRLPARVVAPDSGMGLPSATTAASYSSDAAIGALLRAARLAGHKKLQEAAAAATDDTKSRLQRPSDRVHDGKRGDNDDRGVLRDVPSEIPPKQDSEAIHDGKRERRDQELIGSSSDHGFERESLRRDKYRDNMDVAAEVGRYRDSASEGHKVGQMEGRREEREENLSTVRGPKSEGRAIEQSMGLVDPVQYQGADDAVPTPRYEIPTQSLPPVIMTVERVPDFSKFKPYEPSERLSRKDSFEREVQQAQKAHEATKETVSSISTAAFDAAIEAAAAERRHEYPSDGDVHSRDQSRPSSSASQHNDPILDDADRAYRAARLARRIVAEAERSRSNSPDRSIVDKWKSEKDSEDFHIISPPTTDHPKQKNPYDGPNADVRIDNVLEHPRELSRFQLSKSRRRPSTALQFSARDPSAERERPMLNLVRPTPVPSPNPDKQRFEYFDIPPSTTVVGAHSAPAGALDESVSASSSSAPKAMDSGENHSQHFVVESPGQDDNSYSRTTTIGPITATGSGTGNKIGWGAVAAALSGVGIATSSVSDHAVDMDATREPAEVQVFPLRPERRLLYDDPPTPGPKPASLRGSQLPGRFVEDPVFMANIAAGLEGSGFDPNIVIDDAKFHQRDSPPGSDEPLNPSAVVSSQGAGDSTRDNVDLDFTVNERRDITGDEEDVISSDSRNISKSGKKQRRRRNRTVERRIPDESISTVRDDYVWKSPQSVSEWRAVPASNLENEEKKSDRAINTEYWEDEPESKDSFSIQPDSEPVFDNRADKPSKNRWTKKSKKATAMRWDSSAWGAGSHDGSEIGSLVEASQGAEDANAIELRDWKSGVREFDTDFESTRQDREVSNPFAEASLEDWPARSKDETKMKKKPRRDSVVDGQLSSTTLASELPYESSFDISEFSTNPIPAPSSDLPKTIEENRQASSDHDSVAQPADVHNPRETPSKREFGNSTAAPATSDRAVGEWESPIEWNRKFYSEPLSSVHHVVSDDNMGSLEDNAYSLSDKRNDRTLTTEDEWVDLPMKSKKKKSKRAVTIDKEPAFLSTSRSPLHPEVFVDDPNKTSGKSSVADSPSRASHFDEWDDEQGETSTEKVRNAPGGFPNIEDLPVRSELPDGERGGSESKDKRGVYGSTFFDRLRSSIGLAGGKDQSHTRGSDNGYHLDKAGAIGASVGLTGAAFALASRNFIPKTTDVAPKTVSPQEMETVERLPSTPPEAEFIDPEIVQREIRPAIDPTYGDLLPLPPSRPSTPVPDLDEGIPPLPESRPGTPEDNRERLLLTQKSTHARRRSDTPLRVKTPSHSAIPIQFRLGHRAAPVSPSIVKPSPSSSPVTTTSEPSVASKTRARPMSWESTREFKPLLLVEKTTRGSAVTPTLLREEPQPSDTLEEASHEYHSTVSHTPTHEDFQDAQLLQEAIPPSESPQLPPLWPIQEPDSPTPKPNPLDVVSKNRSSYLLYSSPSSTQDHNDVEISNGSPTLEVSRRRAVAMDTKEIAADDTNDNILRTATVASTTDPLVANAIIHDYVDSWGVVPEAKDNASDMTAPVELTKPSEVIDLDKVSTKNIGPSEGILVSVNDSRAGTEERSKSETIEPLAELANIDTSVHLEDPFDGDVPKAAIKVDEGPDSFAPAKVSKMGEMKQGPSQELKSDSKDVEEPVHVGRQEDVFFDTRAGSVAAEPKLEQADASSFVDPNTDIPSAETIVNIPAHNPIDVFAIAPTSAPAMMPPEAPGKDSIAFATEGPGEASAHALNTVTVEPVTEILALEEPPVDGKKGKKKKKKRKSQAQEPELEERPSQTIPESYLEKSITNESAVAELLALTPAETELEQEALSNISETTRIVSGKDREEEKSSIQGEEESGALSSLGASIRAERSPVEVGLGVVPPVGIETEEQGSEHAQNLPVKTEHIHSGPNEHASEGVLRVLPAEEEQPAAISKKSKKKKNKKSKSVPEPEPLVIADAEIGPGTVFEQTELQVGAPTETRAVSKLDSLEHTMTLPGDSLPHDLSDAVDSSLPFPLDEREEPSPRPEALHLSSSGVRSAITVVGPTSDGGTHNHPGGEDDPTDQVGKPTSVSLEEQIVGAPQTPVLDEGDELSLQPDIRSGIQMESKPEPTVAAENQFIHEAVEDLPHTPQSVAVVDMPSTLPDIISSIQVSSPSQLAGDISDTITDGPEELRNDNKDESEENKQQSTSILPVVQEEETAAAPSEAEGSREQPAHDASSTGQAIDTPLTINDTAMEPERVTSAVEVTPDVISPKKKARKGKKGKKSAIQTDASAVSGAVVLPKSEIEGELEEQGAIDLENLAVTTGSEPTSDVFPPGSPSEKEGKKNIPSMDLSSPVEQVAETIPGADPNIIEGIAHASRRQTDTGPIPITQDDLLAEGEVPATEQIAGVVSKKKSKKDRKKRGSVQLDSGSNDNILETMESSGMHQDAVDPLVGLATDQPGVDIIRAVSDAENAPITSEKSENENTAIFAPVANEGALDPSGSISEGVLGPNDIPDTPVPVKEDDANISSAPAMSKKSKKDKKKRRSVQFAEPIEESVEIPAEIPAEIPVEGAGETATPELEELTKSGETVASKLDELSNMPSEGMGGIVASELKEPADFIGETTAPGPEDPREVITGDTAEIAARDLEALTEMPSKNISKAVALEFEEPAMIPPEGTSETATPNLNDPADAPENTGETASPEFKEQPETAPDSTIEVATPELEEPTWIPAESTGGTAAPELEEQPETPAPDISENSTPQPRRVAEISTEITRETATPGPTTASAMVPPDTQNEPNTPAELGNSPTDPFNNISQDKDEGPLQDMAKLQLEFDPSSIPLPAEEESELELLREALNPPILPSIKSKENQMPKQQERGEAVATGQDIDVQLGSEIANSMGPEPRTDADTLKDAENQIEIDESAIVPEVPVNMDSDIPRENESSVGAIPVPEGHNPATTEDSASSTTMSKEKKRKGKSQDTQDFTADPLALTKNVDEYALGENKDATSAVTIPSNETDVGVIEPMGLEGQATEQSVPSDTASGLTTKKNKKDKKKGKKSNKILDVLMSSVDVLPNPVPKSEIGVVETTDVPASSVEEQPRGRSLESDMDIPLAEERQSQLSEPAVSSPSALQSQGQRSQDDETGVITISDPEITTLSAEGVTMNDPPTVGQDAIPISEPEQPAQTQPAEVPDSEAAISRKSKKDKKKKKRNSQLLANELDTADTTNIEVPSHIQTSDASIEQTATRLLQNSAGDQDVSSHHVEGHVETEPHAENGLNLAIPTSPINVEESVDLPKLPEPSVLPPVGDEAALDEVGPATSKAAKKDKKKKKKQKNSLVDKLSPPELEEQMAETSATVPETEVTTQPEEVSVSSDIPPSDTINPTSAGSPEEDFTNRELANSRGEEAPSEPVIESTQTNFHNPEQHEATPSTEPGNSLAEGPRESEDQPQIEESITVDDISSYQSKIEDKGKQPEVSGNEAISEFLEPVQAGSVSMEHSDTSLPIKIETSLATELPETEVTDSVPASPSEKGKKDKNSKLEDVPTQKIEDTTAPFTTEVEQSNVDAITPSEVSEDNQIIVDSVSNDEDTTRKESTPTGDSFRSENAYKAVPSDDDATQHEIIHQDDSLNVNDVPEDGGALRSDNVTEEKETTSDETAPPVDLIPDSQPLDDPASIKKKKDKKKKKRSSVLEDQSNVDQAEGLTGVTIANMVKPVEDDITQSPVNDENLGDPTPAKKSKKQKKKKKSLSANEPVEGAPTEDSIPAASINLIEPAENRSHASIPKPPNNEDLANTIVGREEKKDEIAAWGASWDDVPGDEPLPGESARTATNDKVEPPINEPPPPEPSNDDNLPQITPTKKKKKDKKKKKKQTGEAEGEVPYEASLKDESPEVSTQKPAQDEPTQDQPALENLGREVAQEHIVREPTVEEQPILETPVPEEPTQESIQEATQGELSQLKPPEYRQTFEGPAQGSAQENLSLEEGHTQEPIPSEEYTGGGAEREGAVQPEPKLEEHVPEKDFTQEGLVPKKESKQEEAESEHLGPAEPTQKEQSVREELPPKDLGREEPAPEEPTLEKEFVQKLNDPKEEPREGVSVQAEDSTKGELAEMGPEQEEPTQEQTEHEILHTQGPFEEKIGDEPPGEASPQEPPPDVVPELVQNTSTPEEPEKATLPQEPIPKTPQEPTAVLSLETPASYEATEAQTHPTTSPSSTPTKSKKGKKKKRQVSSSDVAAVPQESVSLAGIQTSAVAVAVPEAGLPVEGEANEPSAIDDAKHPDLPDPALEDQTGEEKQQELPRADLAQSPVEVHPDSPFPVGFVSSEQTEAGVSLPEIPKAIGVGGPSSIKEGEEDEKKENFPLKDDTPSQPEESQQSSVSIDTSAEAPHDKELVESRPGKKKKNKRRSSVKESESEIRTEGGMDQGTTSREIGAPDQDVVTNPPDHLDTSTLAPESVSVGDVAQSIQLDDPAGSNIESKLSEVLATNSSEGTTRESPSEDQYTEPQITADEGLHELALGTGPVVGNQNLSLQEPETAQPTEAAPKVDDGIDTTLSKKSKKDKKKKKRASQVSWELEPDAEIEDLPGQQQPEQAFDEQPMTSETMGMGKGGEAVEDPFPVFASDNKSKEKTRQSQVDWEPEPNIEKTVKEPKPLLPAQQGQDNRALLDHQSLAEDTQTSLKNSTNLDDTFLETTPSKKSKKKKKNTSQLDCTADPPIPGSPEPAADPLSVEQHVADESLESTNVPSAEAIETKSVDIANADDISPGITLTKQPEEDKSQAKRQSTTGPPYPSIDTRQHAEHDRSTGNNIVGEIETGAFEASTLADNVSRPEESVVPHRTIGAEEQSYTPLSEKTKPPVNQAQATRGSSQGQSEVHDANVPGMSIGIDVETLHDDLISHRDEMVIPNKLADSSNKVLERPIETQQNTETDTTQDAPQQVLESSTERFEAEKKEMSTERALNVSVTVPKANLGANLQSWDWSNIDNQAQPDSQTPEIVSLPKESSDIEPPATVQPNEAIQVAGQQEQKGEQSKKKNIDSNSSMRGEFQSESQALPANQKKSKRDKKKKKRHSHSEPEPASGTTHTRNIESGNEPQDATPAHQTIREAEATKPENDERAEEGSHESPIAADSPHALSVEQPRTGRISEVGNHGTTSQNHLTAGEVSQVQELPSTAHDLQAENPVKASGLTNQGQLTVSETRPRAPSLNRQVSAEISLAQPSSHIEHDRPFDQSTQPDKKVRTELTDDDAMIPEPISALVDIPPRAISGALGSRAADTTALELPSVSEGPIQQAGEDNNSEQSARDPTVTQEKILGQGSRLEASPGDFWAGPGIIAEDQPDVATQRTKGLVASEELPRPTHHQDPGASNVSVRDLAEDSGIVPRVSRSPSIEEADPQGSRDSPDTSRQLEGHENSSNVQAGETPSEPPIPSLPPPRTPSALDYSRGLPPVEEETREDLEKELQSNVKRKTPIVSEADRDSGFIVDSPNPQKDSLDLGEDAGQRDSGVHMRDWAEATTTVDEDDISHVSRASGSHERRSRRSLFDNETPKLSTPTQSRGWDRGGTPDKPREEEPQKRTLTPLKPRSAQHADAGSPGEADKALRPYTPHQQTQRSVSDNISVISDISAISAISRGLTPQSEMAARPTPSMMSISRLRTPEPLKSRPDSPGSPSIHSIHSLRSLRSAGTNTPPLRRTGRRMGGDLRSLSHTGFSSPSHSFSNQDLDRDPTKDSTVDAMDSTRYSTRRSTKDTAREASAPDRSQQPTNTSTTPIANEGRVRSKDMTDVYDGYGEGRIGSPRSPTRPPSMRRRQSMQVLELESKVEQLLAENRALADARAQSEKSLHQRNTSAITDRDAEIESLKASLRWLQNEVTRLTEVNEGLQSANSVLALKHNEKYTQLESQHTTTARELEAYRGSKDQYAQTLQAKDAEIQELRSQLEAAKEQIRQMKEQILATKPPDADFLRLRDEDYFDNRCQQLCSHVQQWVLRFSKFSDMRACRLTSEINDEKIIDRLDNAVLDGSDVDDYLNDRVARRNIFMSMTMNMIWEFVFTRYLFGMDREQRQKLKSLEKILTDVGPTHAVRQWRAITLTLLSKRPGFAEQCSQDREAVVQAILQTLSMILPPPSNLEAQIQYQLRRVMREAVDLSIEMRTQRAEYMMLPPLQPEYDANGELVQTVKFNAALMHERSNDKSTTDEAYEAKGAIVRCVLFPLVVKKGDDNGTGDDEIVVSPAQVLVTKPRRSTIRMVTPTSDAGGISQVGDQSPSAYDRSNTSVNMKDAPLTP